eukprot:COSAG05_NODE_3123_length_2306_cov_1.765745_2_plen_599_part_00
MAEKPDGASAPEPEPSAREVHSAGSTPTSVDVAGAADWTLSPIQPSKTFDFLPALCIFGSMRFPVPDAARVLFVALQAAGVYLKIVDMKAGQDIDKEVYEWIEHCHAFLVFGTKNYGEDTGNSACTYNEVKFAQAKKKNIILLRMIPWEAEFEELQARVLFNRNMLTLEWQQGQPMPPSLVGEILKAMDLPTAGAPGSPAALAHETAQAEAARAQAEAQLAQVQAAAAAAKAQAEAARARAEADEAMAMAAAEEEAARQLQEQVRAAAAAERQRQEQAQRETQKAAALSELEAAEPARAVEILWQAAEDAEIQAASWAIVWRRSDAGPGKANAYGNGIAAADGMAVLAAAMRQHAGEAAVLEQAFHATRILCRQVDNRVAFAAAGGIAAVLRGMGAHVGSAAVQEQGCSALVNLADGEEHKAAIAAAGGIAAVVRGMGAHAGSAAVQEYGCTALSNLAGGSEERRVAIAAAGGIAAVVRAMGAHVGSAAVQASGCGVLWGLANGSDELRVAIVAAGGIAAVVRALGAHVGSAAVQQYGCTALWSIANTTSKDNAVAIQQAGGVKAIANATRAFPSDAEVRRAVDGAMKVIEPKLGRFR